MSMEIEIRDDELSLDQINNVSGGTENASGRVCMRCKSCMQQFWGASREEARKALFIHMDATGHKRIAKARV